MRWNDIKIEWLRKHKEQCSSREELLKLFNLEFKENISFGSLLSACKRNKISLRYKLVPRKEQVEWLKNNKHNYDDREDILHAFNQHFNTNINLNVLRDFNTKYQLCLPKAHRAIDIARGNLKTGWLKLRGFTHKQIGDEIHDGSCITAYIKVSDSQNKRDKYVLKNRYLYEQYNNETLCSDDMILFLDNDYTNFSKENLYKMKRRAHALMVNHRLYDVKSVDKLTLIKYCEWKRIIIDKKENKK